MFIFIIINIKRLYLLLKRKIYHIYMQINLKGKVLGNIYLLVKSNSSLIYLNNYDLDLYLLSVHYKFIIFIKKIIKIYFKKYESHV